MGFLDFHMENIQSPLMVAELSGEEIAIRAAVGALTTNAGISFLGNR